MKPPGPPSPTAMRATNRLLRDLEGTLVRDLRSMIKWASEFDERRKKEPELAECGGLNFSLMLVALIGCEVLGFYSQGAPQHVEYLRNRRRRMKRRKPEPKPNPQPEAARDAEPRMPDPGSYLIKSIEDHFPAGSFFRHLGKVLADELRHDLVHGFGLGGREPGVKLALAVSQDTGFDVRVGTRRKKKTVAMNSVAFAEQFLAAVRRVRERVDAGDQPLVARIAQATRLSFPLGAGVQNQFDSTYALAERKGKTTTFTRRGRRKPPR